MTSTAARIASAQLGVGDTSTEVTDWFRRQLLAALADPMFNTPKAFETWIVDRVAVSGLNIPIGQIVGFSGFLGTSDDVSTSETTLSTSYADLATVGPELTGLADGSYLVWFGAKMSIGTDFEQARMTIALNGVALGDAHCAATQSTKLGSLSHAVGVNTGAVGGNNTLTAKYKTSNGAVTATFENRFLIALKFANP